ncbi:hypothetical protein AAEU42_10075 [Pseudoflavonifractor phocaeensis]|uniref:hypothetical protein n=1 Tax=Pseudoflavonifractor phocaeensis TaxID=1870988 RepID=UPI00313EE137
MFDLSDGIVLFLFVLFFVIICIYVSALAIALDLTLQTNRLYKAFSALFLSTFEKEIDDARLNDLTIRSKNIFSSLCGPEKSNNTFQRRIRNYLTRLYDNPRSVKVAFDKRDRVADLVMAMINRMEATTPEYSEIPSKAGAIFVQLDEALTLNNTLAAKSHLNLLSTEVKALFEENRKQQKQTKLATYTSFAGIALTIIFGIISMK